MLPAADASSGPGLLLVESGDEECILTRYLRHKCIPPGRVVELHIAMALDAVTMFDLLSFFLIFHMFLPAH